MAAIKLLKTYKYLSASSIIESVVAVLLISICALVAFTIYLNVISQNKAIYYYEAKHNIEVIHFKAQKKQDLENETFTYKNYTIDKFVTVDQNKNIAFVDYIINSNNKQTTITKLIAIETTN